MFLTEEGQLDINEMAPRPHNSGHYSINACDLSQFQQHVRAFCNWTLAQLTLLKPAVMVNLLGEHIENTMAKIECLDDMHLHLYGKKVAKEKRKMGHITVLADKIDEAIGKSRISRNAEKLNEDSNNMIERYTRPEMAAIWTEENKFKAWLEVEIL